MDGQWHTYTLTQDHSNHALEHKCYCKNCSCMHWKTETSNIRGAVFCKTCEELYGEPFEQWLHTDCPDDGCEEHCTKGQYSEPT